MAPPSFDMAPSLTASDIPVEGMPVAKEPRDLERYYGTTDLDKIRLNMKTNEGKSALLESVRKNNPDVRDVEKAADQVELNTEQLKKKESFLMKTLKFPIRHPFLTLIGVAGALYGMNALGFKLPAAIEGMLSSVPFEKIKEVLSSTLSLGKGPLTPPGTVNTTFPGVVM